MSLQTLPTNPHPHTTGNGNQAPRWVGCKAAIETHKCWTDAGDRKPRCDWTLSQYVNSAPGMVDKLTFMDSTNNDAAKRLAETKASLEKWQRSWDEKAAQA